MHTSDEYNATVVKLHSTGRYEEGLRLARKGLVRYPADNGLLIAEALCLVDGGEFAPGRERLLALLGRLPQSAEILRGLLVAEARLGLRREMLKTLDRLLATPELSPDDALSAAETLFQCELWRPAVRAFRACLRLREDAQAAMGLAATLQRLRRPRVSEAILRRLLKRIPGESQAVSYLGHLRFDAGDLQEAQELWTSLPLEKHVDPRALQRLLLLRWGRHPLPGFTFLEVRKRLQLLNEERRPAINRDIDGILRGQTAQGNSTSTVVVAAPFDSIESLRIVLRKEGLLDERGKWIGGKRALVVVGKLFGYGKGVLRPFLFLALLRRQAIAVGGYVSVITENREWEMIKKLSFGWDIMWYTTKRGNKITKRETRIWAGVDPELEYFITRKKKGAWWFRLAALAEDGCSNDFVISEARVAGVHIRRDRIEPDAWRNLFMDQKPDEWVGESGYYSAPLSEYLSDAYSFETPIRRQEEPKGVQDGATGETPSNSDGPWRAWQVIRVAEPEDVVEDRTNLVVAIAPLGANNMRYITIQDGEPKIVVVTPRMTK